MSTINKKFLDYDGLSSVANKIKERLIKVTTMPASPSNGDAVLYVGTTTGNYTRGLVYIYNSSTSSWEACGGTTYSEGDGIDISNNTISVEEMPSTDMSEIVAPLPTPAVAGIANPIGCIITMMGVNAPAGYLKCDGTIYNIADYTLLANYFEEQFGTKNKFGGNGTTTFAVPDLRGEFLRGTGTNSHINQGNGTNVGTHQDATEIPYVYAYLNANGSQAQFSARLNPAATDTFNTPSKVDSSLNSTNPVKYVTYSGSTATSSAAKEYDYMIRPTNTSVLYCIKY